MMSPKIENIQIRKNIEDLVNDLIDKFEKKKHILSIIIYIIKVI